MNAKYWQKGDTLDYTPEKTVKSGEVIVFGSRIGIVGNPIKAGESGVIHTEGVFEMSKDNSEITVGSDVYYDETNDCVTTQSEGNTPAGYAIQTATAGSGTVLVKLPG